MTGQLSRAQAALDGDHALTTGLRFVGRLLFNIAVMITTLDAKPIVDPYLEHVEALRDVDVIGPQGWIGERQGAGTKIQIIILTKH